MKYASIDIGTNTILLLIAHIGDTVEDVIDVSSITRLGEGLKKNGYLLNTAMNRSLEVLKNYCNIAKAHDVDGIFCVGTSALREAGNSSQFLEAVKRACGISVEIISGEREAYYTYLSVKTDGLVREDNLFIIDIGGGSTEIIAGNRKRLLDYASLPIGTVKLSEMFIENDPLLEDEIESMKSHIRTFFGKPMKEEGQVLVGTGGTITNLGAIMLGLERFDKEKIHGYSLSLQSVKDIVRKLKAVDSFERAKIKGVEKGREDIITQGAILLEEIMSYYSFRDCIVSTKGVRYGVLFSRG